MELTLAGRGQRKKQILFGGGDGWCYAFDPTPVKEGDTSFLKTVWKFDCNPPERNKFKYPACRRSERDQRHASVLQKPRLRGGRPGP
jgi:hypothetical protein